MNNWNLQPDNSYGQNTGQNNGMTTNYDFSQMPMSQQPPAQMRRPVPQPNSQPVDRFTLQQDGPKQANYYGKIINNAEEIKVCDVPTNGQPAVFPFGDLSAIIVKVWNTGGWIDHKLFLEHVEQPTPQQPDPFQVLYSKLESMEEKLNALTQPAPIATLEVAEEPKTRQTKKKGVADDGSNE